MIQPIQFAVYKGMGGKFGAVQLNLQPAHLNCSKCRMRFFDVNDVKDSLIEVNGKLQVACPNDKTPLAQREGAVFLEATSTKEGQKNVYDWSRKVVIALSPTDIGKILYGFKTGCTDADGNAKEVKIMHDPNAKQDNAGKITKFLTVTSPQGPYKGYMLNVALQDGAETTRHQVPLSPDEALVLGSLLSAAIPRILAWG